MNAFIVVCISVSVLLPMTMGLNCYQCSGGSRGCSDPFNKTGADVSTTGTNNSNIYCKKWVVAGLAIRSGEITCAATSIVLNSGVACCQTDLCNGVRANYQMPIMLIIGSVIILVKTQWI